MLRLILSHKHLSVNLFFIINRYENYVIYPFELKNTKCNVLQRINNYYKK